MNDADPSPSIPPDGPPGRRARRRGAAAALGLGLAALALGYAGPGLLRSPPLALACTALGAAAAALGLTALLRTPPPRCPRCGGTYALLAGRYPLDEADALRTALDLADPDRMARIRPVSARDEQVLAELRTCPRCGGHGTLRLRASPGGVPVRLGPFYELWSPFLDEVREELTRRGGG